MHIIWGTQDLRDGVDIKSLEFYERLASDSVHPMTSQPAPQEFVEAIQKAREEGAEEAVIITISSAMSSTYQSAEQASMMIDDIPITLVDSRANSMSLGWQVLAAARAREAGGNSQAMVEAAGQVRKNLVTLLYVDTLKYLHRGGRIGGAARLLGTAIDLKPQLYVDHKSGMVEAGARTRTKRRALEGMYQAFFKQLDITKPLHIAVLHGNALEEVQKIADRIRQEHNPVELLVAITSPVLGVHTGPGAVALCGYYGA